MISLYLFKLYDMFSKFKKFSKFKIFSTKEHGRERLRETVMKKNINVCDLVTRAVM